MDPYKLLGVGQEATSDEIKSAFHALARQLHPDRDPSPSAAIRFGQVTDAYAMLRDPDRRSATDARLARANSSPGE